MSEPTKRELIIANMRLAKDYAQANKRIRELEARLIANEDRIANLQRQATTVHHAAKQLTKLTTI